MTKLYNFNAIESWDGYTPERLHGGNVRFRAGFARGDHRMLQEEVVLGRRGFPLSPSLLPQTQQPRHVKAPIAATSWRRSVPRDCTRSGMPSQACSVSKELLAGNAPATCEDRKRLFPSKHFFPTGHEVGSLASGGRSPRSHST